MTEQPKLGDTWYRYVDSRERIYLVQLTVVGLTKACVYLYESPGDQPVYSPYIVKYRIRVLKDANKRYAYPTKELAAESYRIRKRWQRIHLERQMKRLDLMESLMGRKGSGEIKEPETVDSPFILGAASHV